MTHMIVLGYCGCTVWPLAVGYAVGKCGRCNNRPEILPISFNDRKKAEAYFNIAAENRSK